MKPHEKHAHPDPAIHPLLAERWSPYSFADRDVADEDLLALFEAARWAPSSYNEQPWRYLVARRADAADFAAILSCLVEGNQGWARAVPVLAIGVAMTRFSRNAKPNKAAHHDLGLAAGNLCVEATARGISVHQMIGIVPERVREVYGLPEDAEPLTALAIGYLGEAAALPEGMRERDLGARSRKPVESFVFAGRWDNAAAFRRG